eukprot:CAMPEP_0194349304 /NCGR_PEP_ID=MMETSP0171-20130528/107016_1 /TAXON_ID=218684 /ORGANISM="Corethron pennatum, Strain L29A3" /LENGTH=168 /DNA_ID=CAMNT_0039116739 /DNA_START=1260 /DNA_END=1766 /DNA_ORIENTATION=-
MRAKHSGQVQGDLQQQVDDPHPPARAQPQQVEVNVPQQGRQPAADGLEDRCGVGVSLLSPGDPALLKDRAQFLYDLLCPLPYDSAVVPHCKLDNCWYPPKMRSNSKAKVNKSANGVGNVVEPSPDPLAVEVFEAIVEATGGDIVHNHVLGGKDPAAHKEFEGEADSHE